MLCVSCKKETLVAYLCDEEAEIGERCKDCFPFEKCEEEHGEACMVVCLDDKLATEQE